MRLSLVLLPLMLFAGAAWSDQVGLRPPESAVELRTYGFGLFPLDGSFSRLHGWMRYDRANQGACEVTLQIEASSLTMENKTVRDRILGPDMMDVAQFPELAFHGICHGEAVIGDLTMHGETHPVSLSYTRARGTVVATGRLRRAEWGIKGMPLIGGSTIRIRVELPDPLGPQHT